MPKKVGNLRYFFCIFIVEIQSVTNIKRYHYGDYQEQSYRIIFIIDEFYKVFDAENAGKLLLSEDGVKRRRRKASLSDSEIMTICLLASCNTKEARMA